MEMSQEIKEMAEALALAQAKITTASKDRENPQFKGSSYATLASVWEACRDALTANGISVVQSPTADANKVTLTTMLLHKSGQWFRDSISLVARDSSPQAIGSAVTYARRYALSAMVSVTPDDDDDGNDAQPSGKQKSKAQERPGFSTGIPLAQHEAEQAAKAKPEPKPQADLGTFEDRILSYRIAKEGNSQGKPWTLYMVQTAENGELCTLDPALIDALKTPITTEERCIIESEPSKGGPKITAFAILATA